MTREKDFAQMHSNGVTKDYMTGQSTLYLNDSGAQFCHDLDDDPKLQTGLSNDDERLETSKSAAKNEENIEPNMLFRSRLNRVGNSNAKKSTKRLSNVFSSFRKSKKKGSTAADISKPFTPKHGLGKRLFRKSTKKRTVSSLPSATTTKSEMASIAPSAIKPSENELASSTSEANSLDSSLGPSRETQSPLAGISDVTKESEMDSTTLSAIKLSNDELTNPMLVTNSFDTSLEASGDTQPLPVGTSDVDDNVLENSISMTTVMSSPVVERQVSLKVNTDTKQTCTKVSHDEDSLLVQERDLNLRPSSNTEQTSVAGKVSGEDKVTECSISVMTALFPVEKRESNLGATCTSELSMVQKKAISISTPSTAKDSEKKEAIKTDIAVTGTFNPPEMERKSTQASNAAEHKWFHGIFRCCVSEEEHNKAGAIY